MRPSGCVADPGAMPTPVRRPPRSLALELTERLHDPPSAPRLAHDVVHELASESGETVPGASTSSLRWWPLAECRGSCAQRSRQSDGVLTGQLTMRLRQPDDGPRTRHHAVGVVAATARGQPATLAPSMSDRRRGGGRPARTRPSSGAGAPAGPGHDHRSRAARRRRSDGKPPPSSARHAPRSATRCRRLPLPPAAR